MLVSGNRSNMHNVKMSVVVLMAKLNQVEKKVRDCAVNMLISL